MILTYTLLVCLSIFIFSPFVLIMIKSIGKDWFGKLWLPPTRKLKNWGARQFSNSVVYPPYTPESYPNLHFSPL